MKSAAVNRKSQANVIGMRKLVQVGRLMQGGGLFSCRRASLTTFIYASIVVYGGGGVGARR